MQCIPLCLDCKNWGANDKCPYYTPIPPEIKLREQLCTHYTGGEYTVFSGEKK